MTQPKRNIRSASLPRANENANALRISEERVSAILQVALDAIVAIDEQNIITEFNPAAEAMFGYTRDEAIGTSLAERIIPMSQREPHNIGLEHYVATGFGPIIGKIREVNAMRKDGTEFPVEMAITAIKLAAGTEFIAHIRDISRRKSAEAQLAAASAKNERIAETLQRSMLRASPDGALPGMRVETLYEAALNEADVGGDFFDAFPLNSETVVLVVGDVSGKGLSAAARTAEARYALRAFLHDDHAPQFALTRLNEFICSTHLLDKDDNHSFIVLAVNVVNTTTGHAEFASAGAEPTLILRVDGTIEQVATMGTPIGVVPDSEFVAKTTVLEPGDTLIMATDGITEARRGNDFLGIEGMAALAEKAGAAKSIHELTQAIYNGARSFANGNLRDDICLLLARRVGPQPSAN